MAIGYVGLGSMGGALAARLQLTHPLTERPTLSTPWRRRVPWWRQTCPQSPPLATSSSSAFRPRTTSATCCSEALVYPVHSALIVDQTTGDPNETRAMAADLATCGIDLIDAPVSGGIAGAEAGTIAIMVGADAAQHGRVLPILQAISTNVFHAGGVGNGHVIKLVNNLMSCVQRLLSFEAMALPAKNGVDPKTATAVLVASGGRNAYMEKMMGPRILEGKLNVGFTLGLAHKDVRLACQLGIDSAVPMFFGNIARELYQNSIAEMGHDNQVDTVGFMFDRLAQTSVVPRHNDLNVKADLEDAQS